VNETATNAPEAVGRVLNRLVGVSLRRCRRGVISCAMPQGDTMGFAPPLGLAREAADTIAAAVQGAIEEVAATQ